MLYEKNFECAGNLLEEIEEMKKIAHDEYNVEAAATTTADCHLFLTIYCC